MGYLSVTTLANYLMVECFQKIISDVVPVTNTRVGTFSLGRRQGNEPSTLELAQVTRSAEAHGTDDHYRAGTHFFKNSNHEN